MLTVSASFFLGLVLSRRASTLAPDKADIPADGDAALLRRVAMAAVQQPVFLVIDQITNRLGLFRDAVDQCVNVHRLPSVLP